MAGIVFNFTLAGALLRPTTFYTNAGSDKTTKKYSEIKQKVKSQDVAFERELTLLVEDDDMNDAAASKLYRSNGHINNEPTERFRAYSDTSRIKNDRKDKENDNSASVRSLGQFVVSRPHQDFVSLSSDLEIIGSKYGLSTAQVEKFEEQNDKNRVNVEMTCLTITKAVKSILLQIFNKEVLCNRLYIMFIFVAAINVVGMVQITTFLPAHSEDIGISRQDIALLLTIMGSLDLVSRLALAAVSDLKILKRHHILAITAIITGIVTNFIHFFRDFNTMLVLVITFGLFGQVYDGMHPIIIADFVGVEHMSTAMGFTTLLHGIMLSISSPLMGNIIFLKDFNIKIVI